MKLLLFFLLVGLALAAPQLQETSLEDSLGSYLPPDEECRPSTIYQTETEYSTRVRYTTVLNPQAQIQTRTEYKTQTVPSTIYSQVVSTQVVPSIVYQTNYVTNTVYNTRTSYVQGPANTEFVTVTETRDQVSVQYSTQISTQYRQNPSTVYREFVSTQFLPRPVYSTVYSTQIVTQTQRVPGRNQVVVQNQTPQRLSVQVGPAQTVYRTSTVFSNIVQYSTVYGRAETRVATTTQYQPVYTTVYSERVDYRTSTRVVTQTQFDQRYSTIYSTVQVPQIITRTINNDRQVVSVVYSTQLIPTTFYSTYVQTTQINRPAQTSYVVQTVTQYQSQFQPAQIRTIYQTRVLYNNNYVTSTAYRTQYNTVLVTRTQPGNCNTGYYYRPPTRPLIFERF